MRLGTEYARSWLEEDGRSGGARESIRARGPRARASEATLLQGRGAEAPRLRHAAAGIEQHILRLEVTVYHWRLLSVKVCHCPRHTLGDRQQLILAGIT